MDSRKLGLGKVVASMAGVDCTRDSSSSHVLRYSDLFNRSLITDDRMMNGLFLSAPRVVSLEQTENRP